MGCSQNRWTNSPQCKGCTSLRSTSRSLSGALLCLRWPAPLLRSRGHRTRAPAQQRRGLQDVRGADHEHPIASKWRQGRPFPSRLRTACLRQPRPESGAARPAAQQERGEEFSQNKCYHVRLLPTSTRGLGAERRHMESDSTEPPTVLCSRQSYSLAEPLPVGGVNYLDRSGGQDS